MIGIIDCGMGNILSVKNAFEKAGGQAKICTSPEDMEGADKLVLPGVGSFGDCVTALKNKGFIVALNEAVIKKSVPILGICLGMQVMARKGFENGEHEGLGWFDAEVERLCPSDKTVRVPHIGWNNIEFSRESFLFKGIPASPDVYFVHSYYMKCSLKEDIDATFDYSGTFTAAVRKNNIVGTQFHPEKSQDIGQIIIRNFLNWDFKQ